MNELKTLLNKNDFTCKPVGIRKPPSLETAEENSLCRSKFRHDCVPLIARIHSQEKLSEHWIRNHYQQRTYAFRLRASMESFISVVASSDGILLWSIKWFSYILASAREYRGVTSLNIYLPVETSTVTGNFLLFPGCGISSCNMRSMNLLDKDVHMTWFNPIIHDRCATAIDFSSDSMPWKVSHYLGEDKSIAVAHRSWMIGLNHVMWTSLSSRFIDRMLQDEMPQPGNSKKFPVTVLVSTGK